jgi:cephalosporin hydroxylase
LFYVTLCDLIGRGNVISIKSLLFGNLPEHPPSQYMIGLSVSPYLIKEEKECLPNSYHVMAVLDSIHEEDHISQELWAYPGLVFPGCYLVGGDTRINGLPALSKYGPGPLGAPRKFLLENGQFRSNQIRDGYSLTLNPGGYFLKFHKSGAT